LHYTNKKMIPLHVVRGIKHSWEYSKGDADFSVTELLQPPKVRALKIQHKDELVEDYSDNIASFIGTCVHKMLENANENSENLDTEMRINTEVNVDGKSYIISGCIDVIDHNENKIIDYKTTSAYAVINDKKDWDNQLNIYAWLYALAFEKKEMPSAEVVAFLKDWSKSRSKNSNTYPQSAVFTKPIIVWSMEEVENFIKERIRIHVDALTNTQDVICSDEDVWLTSKGKANRCEDWCNVNQFCNQYKNYMEEK